MNHFVLEKYFFLLFSNSFSNSNFICRYFFVSILFSSSSDGSSSNSSTQQTGKLQKSLCCIGSKTRQDKLPRVQPNLTLSKFYYFSIVFVFHYNFPPRKLGKRIHQRTLKQKRRAHVLYPLKTNENERTVARVNTTFFSTQKFRMN